MPEPADPTEAVRLLPKQHLDSYAQCFRAMPPLRKTKDRYGETVWKTEYREHSLLIEPPNDHWDQWKIWVKGPGWQDAEHADSDSLKHGLEGVLRTIDWHLHQATLNEG